MRVARMRVLGFRNLRRQEIELGPRVTVLWGPNGAGKTNVLEALFAGLAGTSCRTRRDREAIAFGEPLARVEVDVEADTEDRAFLWSLGRDGDRRHLLDGDPLTVERAHERPALEVFLPDRLALVKGPPAVRRSHLDRLVAALWPARAETRRRYGRALAQRNALLGRVRAGMAPADSLDAWDLELAKEGRDLSATRREAVATLAPEFASAAAELGLAGEATLGYAPRSEATTPEALASELAERRSGDVERGYTGHGPHLDEVDMELDGRAIRRYASQGEQRAALLALLFAERRALLEARREPPLMLLDDVMSELDPDRRRLLAARLAEGEGQTVITATEPDHVPAGRERLEIAVRDGDAVLGVADPPPEARSPAASAFAA
jgi:DNA replication and repair protein RecF